MKGENPMEQQRDDNWMETARMFAGNADYWRKRAERAEQVSFQRAWWAIRRFIANHITARQ